MALVDDRKYLVKFLRETRELRELYENEPHSVRVYDLCIKLAEKELAGIDRRLKH